jgi:mycothiol system anti-sigma-R factor
MGIPDCGPECQQTLVEIEQFLDGELDVAVHTRIERHLSDCNPCMQRLEFRRYVKVVVSSKCGHEDLPAGLRDRIRELIREPGPLEA